jgi:hypothetical protein
MIFASLPRATATAMMAATTPETEARPGRRSCTTPRRRPSARPKSARRSARDRPGGGHPRRGQGGRLAGRQSHAHQDHRLADHSDGFAPLRHRSDDTGLGMSTSDSHVPADRPPPGLSAAAESREAAAREAVMMASSATEHELGDRRESAAFARLLEHQRHVGSSSTVGRANSRQIERPPLAQTEGALTPHAQLHRLQEVRASCGVWRVACGVCRVPCAVCRVPCAVCRFLCAACVVSSLILGGFWQALAAEDADGPGAARQVLCSTAAASPASPTAAAAKAKRQPHPPWQARVRDRYPPALLFHGYCVAFLTY